jgi:6-phosphogluconolactonase
MKNFDLISFATADELACAAAGAWLEEAASANRAGQPHCVALSGGRTAQEFFAAVVRRAKTRAVSFGRIRFFWADERCVPPNDPESNFRLAHEFLFVPLKIPDAQIHRIPGEMPPEAAAARAASEICRVAPLNASGQPVLDLVLLSMGEDGHVASLFPGESEAVISSKAVYRAVKNSPKPPPNRITLGYTALAAARQVWVLVSGASKETALRDSLALGKKTPLGQLIQSRSNTRIFNDFQLI